MFSAGFMMLATPLTRTKFLSRMRTARHTTSIMQLGLPSLCPPLKTEIMKGLTPTLQLCNMTALYKTASTALLVKLSPEYCAPLQLSECASVCDATAIQVETESICHKHQEERHAATAAIQGVPCVAKTIRRLTAKTSHSDASSLNCLIHLWQISTPSCCATGAIQV